MLAHLLREIRSGETLVVVRLDRLARSVSHLLAVIEQLEAQGAHFRSLGGQRLIAHCKQIAAQLDDMRGTRWHPSSVKHLFTRMEKLGLAGGPPHRSIQGSGDKPPARSDTHEQSRL